MNLAVTASDPFDGACAELAEVLKDKLWERGHLPQRAPPFGDGHVGSASSP